jgi:hypothetical protein
MEKVNIATLRNNQLKSSFIILTCVFLYSFSGQKRGIDLLCHKWRQIGIKSFGKKYHEIDKAMSELIWFKKDGTFEKELYGSLNFKGKWLFSKDSSKLALALTEMNGTSISGPDSFDNRFANDSIITLTYDTFIDAQLKYYGEQKIYGHDDVYYLRED